MAHIHAPQDGFCRIKMLYLQKQTMPTLAAVYSYNHATRTLYEIIEYNDQWYLELQLKKSAVVTKSLKF